MADEQTKPIIKSPRTTIQELLQQKPVVPDIRTEFQKRLDLNKQKPMTIKEILQQEFKPIERTPIEQLRIRQRNVVKNRGLFESQLEALKIQQNKESDSPAEFARFEKAIQNKQRDINDINLHNREIIRKQLELERTIDVDDPRVRFDINVLTSLGKRGFPSEPSGLVPLSDITDSELVQIAPELTQEQYFLNVREFQRGLKSLTHELRQERIRLESFLLSAPEGEITGERRTALENKLERTKRDIEGLELSRKRTLKNIGSISRGNLPKPPDVIPLIRWNSMGAGSRASLQIKKGFMQFGESMLGLTEMLANSNVFGSVSPSHRGLQLTAQAISPAEKRAQINEGIQYLTPPEELHQFSDDVYAQIGNLIPQVAATFASGGASAAMFGAGTVRTAVVASVASGTLQAAVESGSVYGTNKDAGLSHEQSSKAALTTFAIILPAAVILNRYGEFLTPAEAGIAKKFLVNIPNEAVEEMFQTAVSNTQTGRPWDEGILEAGAFGAMFSAAFTSAGVSSQRLAAMGLPTPDGDGNFFVNPDKGDVPNLNQATQSEIQGMKAKIAPETMTLGEVYIEMDKDPSKIDVNEEVLITRDPLTEKIDSILTLSMLGEIGKAKEKLANVQPNVQEIFNEWAQILPEDFEFEQGKLDVETLLMQLRDNDVYLSNQDLKIMGQNNVMMEIFEDKDGNVEFVRMPSKVPQPKMKRWKNQNNSTKIENLFDSIVGTTINNKADIESIRDSLKDKGFQIIENNDILQYLVQEEDGSLTVDREKLATDFGINALIQEAQGADTMARSIIEDLQAQNPDQVIQLPAIQQEIVNRITSIVEQNSFGSGMSQTIDGKAVVQGMFRNEQFTAALEQYKFDDGYSASLSKDYSNITKGTPDTQDASKITLQDEIDAFIVEPDIKGVARLVSAGFKSGVKSFQLFWEDMVKRLGSRIDNFSAKFLPQFRDMWTDMEMRLKQSAKGGIKQDTIIAERNKIVEKTNDKLAKETEAKINRVRKQESEGTINEEEAINQIDAIKVEEELRMSQLRDRIDNPETIEPFTIFTNPAEDSNLNVERQVAKFINTIRQMFPEIDIALDNVIINMNVDEKNINNYGSFDSFTGTLILNPLAFTNDSVLMETIGHEVNHARGETGLGNDTSVLNYFAINRGERAARIYGRAFKETLQNTEFSSLIDEVQNNPDFANNRFGEMLDTDIDFEGGEQSRATEMFKKKRLDADARLAIDGWQFKILDQQATLNTLQDQMEKKYGELPTNLSPELNVNLGQRSNRIVKSIIEDGLVDEVGNRVKNDRGKDIPSLLETISNIDKKLRRPRTNKNGRKSGYEVYHEILEKYIATKDDAGLSEFPTNFTIKDHLMNNMDVPTDIASLWLKSYNDTLDLVDAVKQQFNFDSDVTADKFIQNLVRDEDLQLTFEDTSMKNMEKVTRFIDVAVRNFYATAGYRTLINQSVTTFQNDPELSEIHQTYFKILEVGEPLTFEFEGINHEAMGIEVNTTDESFDFIPNIETSETPKKKAAVKDGNKSVIKDIYVDGTRYKVEMDPLVFRAIESVNVQETNKMIKFLGWWSRMLKFGITGSPLWAPISLAKDIPTAAVIGGLNVPKALVRQFPLTSFAVPGKFGKDIRTGVINRFNDAETMKDRFKAAFQPLSGFSFDGENITMKQMDRTFTQTGGKNIDNQLRDIAPNDYYFNQVFNKRVGNTEVGTWLEASTSANALVDSLQTIASSTQKGVKAFTKVITTAYNTPGEVSENWVRLQLYSQIIEEKMNAFDKMTVNSKIEAVSKVRNNVVEEGVETKRIQKDDGVLIVQAGKTPQELRSAYLEEAKKIAASRAISLMDYTKTGTWARNVNAAIPYVNSAFQGYSAFASSFKRAVRSDKGGTKQQKQEVRNALEGNINPETNELFTEAEIVSAISKSRPIVKQTTKWLVRAGLVYVLPKLIEALAWKDDDDYQNLNEYTKDSNIIIGKDETTKTFIKIPVEEQFAALIIAPSRKLFQSWIGGDSQESRKAALGNDAELFDILGETLKDFAGESFPLGRNITSAIPLGKPEQTPGTLNQREGITAPTIPFLNFMTSLSLAENTGDEKDLTWFNFLHSDENYKGIVNQQGRNALNFILRNKEVPGKTQAAREKFMRSPEYTDYLIESIIGNYNKNAADAITSLWGAGPQKDGGKPVPLVDLLFRRFRTQYSFPRKANINVTPFKFNDMGLDELEGFDDLNLEGFDFGSINDPGF